MTWRIVFVALLPTAVLLAYGFAQDQTKNTDQRQTSAGNVQITQTAADRPNNDDGLHIAQRVGLYGKWQVVSSEKDGAFSEAQIGQRDGDVISILPSSENSRFFLS